MSDALVRFGARCLCLGVALYVLLHVAAVLLGVFFAIVGGRHG